MKIAYIHVHAYVNVYNLKETYFAHIKKWACLYRRFENSKSERLLRQHKKGMTNKVAASARCFFM